MKHIRKITLANINNIRLGFEKIAAGTRLATIAGVIRSCTQRTTDGGVSVVVFIGNFRAWNYKGAEFSAPSLVLPAPVEAGLFAAFAAPRAEGTDLEFAVEIEWDPGTFVPRFLISPRASNALGPLLAELAKVKARKA